MKRTTKIISFALVLAVVLSVFGIMASFAEDTDTALAPRVTLDLDSIKENTISIANSVNVSHDNNTPNDPSDDYSGPGLTMTKEKDENGEVYWLLQSHALAGQKHGSGSYLNYSGNGINPSYVLRTHDNTKNGQHYVKNVDFFVFDFDVSTDTELFKYAYFHYRNYTNANGNAQNASSYPGLYGDDLESLYYSTGSSTPSASVAGYPTSALKNEWVDITLVYDYRGEDPSKWALYVYFDGNFVGKYTACTNTSYRSFFYRLTVPNTAVNDFESMKFRNWTYTNFPVGWTGDLTVDNMLGQYAVSLSEIDELAYCLEGSDAPRNEKLATIERAGDVFDVYSFDDLDASFVDGDVVTLHKNINKPLIVNANVTFTDNGYTHKEVDLTGVNLSTAAYLVLDRTTRAVTASGTAEEFSKLLPTNNKLCVLLSDVTYTNTSSAKTGSKVNFVYDLNGYNVTFEGSKRVFVAQDINDIRMLFKNGTFHFNNTAGDFTLTSGNNAFVFEDLELLKLKSGTFIDHRRGAVRFINCNDIECGYLVSAKSNDLLPTSVIIDNCNISLTGTSSPLGVSNVSTSSMRRGSAVSYIIIKDSKIDFASGGTAPFISVEGYGNATGKATFDADGNLESWVATPERDANRNEVKISFVNSEITADHYLVSTDVVEVRAFGNYDSDTAKEYLYVNDNFSLDVDIDVVNSKLDADYLVNQKFSSTAYNTATHPEQLNYTYNVNVNVDSSMIFADTAYLLYSDTSKANASFGINFTGECGFPSADFFGGAREVNNTAVLDSTYTVVPRSNPDFPPYALSRKLASYPYIIGEHEYEFLWYADDQVDASKIPVELPPNSKYFTYKWGERNLDGAYPAIITDTVPVKANLTLYSDFTLNIYLPTDLGATAYATAEVNGESTPVYTTTVEGVDYRVVQVKGIHPANAGDKIALTFDVEDGGMTAKVTKELSVIEYLAKALATVTSNEDKALIASMINYIDAAYAYVGIESAELDALIATPEYQAISLTKSTTLEAKSTVSDLGIFDAVALSLNNSLRITFKVKESFEGNVVFTYQKNGRKYVVTEQCDGGEELTLDLKSYELIQDIKISYGPDSGVYNISAYMDFAKNDEALTALLDALWIYAEKSAAYKAQNP